MMISSSSTTNTATPKATTATELAKKGAAGDETFRDEETASISHSSDHDNQVTSSDDNNDDDDDADDSSYASDDSGSSWDSDMDDLEAAILAKTQPSILQQTQSPAMQAILNRGGNDSGSDTNGGDFFDPKQVLPGLYDLKQRMKKSESTAYLQSAVTKSEPETLADPYASTHPDDFLQQLLEGISAKSFPSETWHDYFQEMHPDHVEAYTTEIVQAIRHDHYDVLRDHLRAGYTLQCCNSHGESIVHLCCRRGSTGMLQFLLEEAGVCIRIRDDKGRTPLHDACWSDKPKFDLVYMLLQSSPELLFVQDHRGHTPLTYVPRQQWGEWCHFLQKHRVFLRASVRSLRFDRAKYLVRNCVPCLKY